jgi:hypothetical protein
MDGNAFVRLTYDMTFSRAMSRKEFAAHSLPILDVAKVETKVVKNTGVSP